MGDPEPALPTAGPLPRVACLGECMIELRERPDGLLSRSFGGDTLNTAVYLARLGVSVDYVTALGTDAFSDDMLAAWHQEGVGTGHVLRAPGQLPGLYLIQTNAEGERRFSYWRDHSPVRQFFALPGTDIVQAALLGFDVIYLSGITLSLFAAPERVLLWHLLDTARARGARIVFDTNFRPRGWPDNSGARQAYAAMLQCSDIVLASVEDFALLFGQTLMPAADAQAAAENWLAQPMQRELVLRSGDLACRIFLKGQALNVPGTPAASVVDTTAAGDSFAAAYLAARLRGQSPGQAAQDGHRLAGIVVGHAGAIIPRAAMKHVAADPKIIM